MYECFWSEYFFPIENSFLLNISKVALFIYSVTDLLIWKTLRSLIELIDKTFFFEMLILFNYENLAENSETDIIQRNSCGKFPGATHFGGGGFPDGGDGCHHYGEKRDKLSGILLM